MTVIRVFITALAALALACGCGSSTTDAPNTSPNHTQQQPSSPGLSIDITISDGTVTPTNAEFEAKVGQPIRLRVSSDAPDELHVHSVPDHTFAVEAKPNQSFEFTVDVPGQVDVELHDLARTVAIIQVQQ